MLGIGLHPGMLPQALRCSTHLPAAYLCSEASRPDPSPSTTYAGPLSIADHPFRVKDRGRTASARLCQSRGLTVPLFFLNSCADCHARVSERRSSHRAGKVRERTLRSLSHLATAAVHDFFRPAEREAAIPAPSSRPSAFVQGTVMAPREGVALRAGTRTLIPSLGGWTLCYDDSPTRSSLRRVARKTRVHQNLVCESSMQDRARG
ncbi:hypothetical protein BV20DRAFT_962728, partial [Pilatotrama ljubarskyi]